MRSDSTQRSGAHFTRRHFLERLSLVNGIADESEPLGLPEEIPNNQEAMIQASRDYAHDDPLERRL